jgi:lipopolysaccharide/colanic/teichoic acid biosynthesis glycosyltransferase
MDENELRNARERRKRNIAIGLALAGLVILFFVMTMVRLKGHVFDWTS